MLDRLVHLCLSNCWFITSTIMSKSWEMRGSLEKVFRLMTRPRFCTNLMKKIIISSRLSPMLTLSQVFMIISRCHQKIYHEYPRPCHSLWHVSYVHGRQGTRTDSSCRLVHQITTWVEKKDFAHPFWIFHVKSDPEGKLK